MAFFKIVILQLKMPLNYFFRPDKSIRVITSMVPEGLKIRELCVLTFKYVSFRLGKALKKLKQLFNLFFKVYLFLFIYRQK